jgi:hypothetical protein
LAVHRRSRRLTEHFGLIGAEKSHKSTTIREYSFQKVEALY